MNLNTDQHFVQLLGNDEEYKIYVNLKIVQAKEDGLKEGLEQGHANLLAAAKNTFDKGLDINFVSEITKLPIEELERVSKEN